MKPQCNLLFLHGWGVSSNVMDALSEKTIENCNINSPSLYELAELSADFKLTSIANILVEKIQTETVVVAWSLGGLIAILLTKQTDKIKGIVFISSTPCFKNKPGWENVLDVNDIEKLKQQLAINPKQALNYFAGLIAHGDAETKKTARILKQHMAKEQDAQILSALLDELLTQDLRAEFEGLSLPVLYILAQHDSLIDPQIINQLKELQPNASYELIEGCGHAPFISQPDAMAGLVNKFLGGLHG